MKRENEKEVGCLKDVGEFYLIVAQAGKEARTVECDECACISEGCDNILFTKPASNVTSVS